MVIGLVSVGSGGVTFPKSISCPPLPVDSVISSRRKADAAKAVNLMYNFAEACFNVKLDVAKIQ